MILRMCLDLLTHPAERTETQNLLSSAHCSDWCVMALSLLGKTAIMTGFDLLYTYSAELFPITHRGTGLASCSMVARVGSLVSPYIADMRFFVSGKMVSVLPQLVLGTCAIAGALLILLLPETRGRELPETLEDIQRKPLKETKSSALNVL
ncbi:hypothetical protein RRG08_025568 [Elysia crispata]|uniref:Uncharacterized protein n=1 Tax=Elysia crispata TaxID=231223 RepID=A0AAE0YXH8_9GAST|nr:hypothetical protein RRG08_025568 [Elysia crispata]